MLHSVSQTWSDAHTEHRSPSVAHVVSHSSSTHEASASSNIEGASAQARPLVVSGVDSDADDVVTVPEVDAPIPPVTEEFRRSAWNDPRSAWIDPQPGDESMLAIRVNNRSNAESPIPSYLADVTPNDSVCPSGASSFLPTELSETIAAVRNRRVSIESKVSSMAYDPTTSLQTALKQKLHPVPTREALPSLSTSRTYSRTKTMGRMSTTSAVGGRMGLPPGHQGSRSSLKGNLLPGQGGLPSMTPELHNRKSVLTLSVGLGSVGLGPGTSSLDRMPNVAVLFEEWKPSTRCPRLRECLSNLKDAIQPHCRALINKRGFTVMMLFFLVSALFLPDFWIVIDRPDNKDLDVFLTFVLFFFLFEIVVQAVALTRTYLGSFFFWMDLLGAISVILDLSYIAVLWSSDNQAVFSDNVILMRAARIAKLGARAGRFTKLVKLLRFLPGVHQQQSNVQTASVISGRLITALSTRISCLIIIMVMIMPVFSMWSFPDQDWSLYSWLDLLEDVGQTQPQQFEVWLGQFQDFYHEKKYSPYKVVATFATVSQTWEFSSPHGAPNRGSNRVRVESAHVKVDFNFTTPNWIDALMSMCLIMLVMLLMIVFSLMLTASVSRVVLLPLERLLHQLRSCAGKIFDSVSDMTHKMDDQDDEPNVGHASTYAEESGFESETALLAKVIDKLAVLGALFIKKGFDEDIEGLDDENRAYFNQYQGTAYALEDALSSEPDFENFRESVFEAEIAMIESAGLSLDLIDSWDLNPLELDRPRCHAAAMFFVGPHNHGINVDAVLMGNFLDALEAAYNTIPYHNWFHAVDVTHCMYRLLKEWSADKFLSGQERYALLVSSTGHDVGHEGFSNSFLMETGHELAMRYNDRSPLENMHCANLFEISRNPRNDIFATHVKKDYQDLRKMIAEAILFTDTARHFDMLKDLQVMYEMNSEVFNDARHKYKDNFDAYFSGEVAETLRNYDSRSLVRKMLLHLADISNPTKPFRICRVWAWKICEEFFTQGDTERAMDIPVASLNDREKNNRPFSQVGFIEFLVAPFAFAVMKVFPPFDECVGTMIVNLKKWQEMWATTSPEPSQEEQQVCEQRIAKIESRFLAGG